MKQAMRTCFVVVLLLYATISEAVTAPGPGRAYLLYNALAADNPYEYLAWTTDPWKVPNADGNNPGLYMEVGYGVVPPQSLWIFDLKSDKTFRIYNLDNSYSGNPRRLDVQADGSRPFLGLIGSTSIGQVWQINVLADGTHFTLYNQVWSKAMDIEVSSTPANLPFMNSNVQASLKGQAWKLSDHTPTSLLTVTSVVTEHQTITPAPTTVYVGGGQVQVTSTSVVLSTTTLTITATQQAIGMNKRDDLKMPTPTTITSTVATITITTTSLITLPTSTNSVTSGGGTNNIVVVSTSIVTSTTTSMIVLINTGNTIPTSNSTPSSKTAPTSGVAGALNPSNAPAAQGKSHTTALAAGLGAGLGIVFTALISLLALMLWRQKKKQGLVETGAEAGVGGTNETSELPSEGRVISEVGMTNGVRRRDTP